MTQVETTPPSTTEKLISVFMAARTFKLVIDRAFLFSSARPGYHNNDSFIATSITFNFTEKGLEVASADGHMLLVQQIHHHGLRGIDVPEPYAIPKPYATMFSAKELLSVAKDMPATKAPMEEAVVELSINPSTGKLIITKTVGRHVHDAMLPPWHTPLDYKPLLDAEHRDAPEQFVALNPEALAALSKVSDITNKFNRDWGFRHASGGSVNPDTVVRLGFGSRRESVHFAIPNWHVPCFGLVMPMFVQWPDNVPGTSTRPTHW